MGGNPRQARVGLKSLLTAHADLKQEYRNTLERERENLHMLRKTHLEFVQHLNVRIELLDGKIKDSETL